MHLRRPKTLLLVALALALAGSSCARRQFSPPTYYQVGPSHGTGASK